MDELTKQSKIIYKEKLFVSFKPSSAIVQVRPNDAAKAVLKIKIFVVSVN